MEITRRTLLSAASGTGVASAAGGGTLGEPIERTDIRSPRAEADKMPVIDIHTHMFSAGWSAIARQSQDDRFKLGTGDEDGMLLYRGQSIGRIVPAMLDFEQRIAAMDQAGVDIAVITLTAPNVYWGTRAQSAAAARAINDDFAAAEQRYRGRIRWMASLPWEYADDAIAELKRASALGAVGVCTLTNILGTPLTDPRFRPIWQAIEAIGLPVFVHPTTSYVDGMGLEQYGMFNSVGFTSETSACFIRMIFSGFLDEFKALNLIACHGGGAFPYLMSRFDIMWERTGGAGSPIDQPPSHYMRRIYFDSVVYDQNTLAFLVAQAGADRVLYGSDYPFLIGDMAGVLNRVDQLPLDQRAAIRGGNAIRLFKL